MSDNAEWVHAVLSSMTPEQRARLERFCQQMAEEMRRTSWAWKDELLTADQYVVPGDE